ncbi:MAG TPA: FtsX-like permease family protein, partial [Verrucomicrobiae bacterium]|nr:FtsX-like permease family protein [Verrucomicrobiae bacterium]
AFSELSVVIRSTRPASEVFGLLRQELRKADPNLAPYAERTLTDAVDASLAPRRYAMQLVGVFAVTALVLALAGVYGVISCLASQRLRELGIRAALGALPGDLRALVLRQGLALIIPGIVAGLLASLVLTRFLRSLLFNVAANDTLTLGVASLVSLAVALLACWLPARRAAKVDPIAVLRND